MRHTKKPAAVADQINHPNRRRIDRADGEQLLFGAAQDVARQRGLLADGMQASPEHSHLERGRFKLRDRMDHLIVAIPVQEVRDRLAYRRELAREVLRKAGVELKANNPAALERGKIRMLSTELRAITWAISTGRRVPYRKRIKLVKVWAVLLLLCGVVPGLVFLGWLWWRDRHYQRELSGLVHRWIRSGKPEPDGSFFRLYAS